MLSKTFKLFLILLMIQKIINEREDVKAESRVLNDIGKGIAPLSNNESFITIKTEYNKNIRPSLPSEKYDQKEFYFDSKGALYVWLQFSLRQIISLDEKNQILTSSSYLYITWNDPRLSWNPANYSNTYSITTSASAFWIPDLAVMNAAGTVQFISIPSNQNIIITYVGQIFLTLFLSGLQTRCKLNVYKYPFDKQNCSIVIGSWMSDTENINFGTKTSLNESFDMENYTPHTIWRLKSFEQSSSSNEGRFMLFNNIIDEYELLDINKTVTEDISFNIIIVRQPMYIMMNGMFPLFVLNSVILLAFFLPFSSQIGLCMTSFLTFSVSGLRISSDIPIQSEYLPLITLYIFLSILFTFLGLIWFILVNSYSTKKSMPKFLKKIVKLENIIIENVCCSKLNVIETKQAIAKEVLLEKPNILKETNTNKTAPIKVANQNKDKEDCNFCKRCDKCNEKFQKEQNKSKENTEFESELSLLNMNVFFILFFTILASNLLIWIIIST